MIFGPLGTNPKFIRAQSDGSLSLKEIQSHFPGTADLRYRDPATGSLVKVGRRGGDLDRESWGDEPHIAIKDSVIVGVWEGEENFNVLEELLRLKVELETKLKEIEIQQKWELENVGLESDSYKINNNEAREPIWKIMTIPLTLRLL